MPCPKTHLVLLVMSFVTWFGFVLVGWPDYYQQYSFNVQVGVVVAVTLLYVWLAPVILRCMDTKDFVSNSWWLALYLTVPLATYDYIYLAIMQGDDFTYLYRYWYLTFFYFSFWIQFPISASFMTPTHERLPLVDTK